LTAITSSDATAFAITVNGVNISGTGDSNTTVAASKIAAAFNAVSSLKKDPN
jgi:hypothetical protein